MKPRDTAFLFVGLFVGMLIGFQVGSNPKPTVAKPETTFKVGEKVTYLNSEGTVVSTYRGNRYLVNYCGNIGWFDHYDCGQSMVSADELGKKQ